MSQRKLKWKVGIDPGSVPPGLAYQTSRTTALANPAVSEEPEFLSFQSPIPPCGESRIRKIYHAHLEEQLMENFANPRSRFPPKLPYYPVKACLWGHIDKSNRLRGP